MGSSYVVSTPASQLPIEADAARLHCRMDEGEDDELIEGYIRDAVAAWESRTGVLLMAQTIDLYMDGFCPQIRVARLPIRSITSITYVDTSGATQTLDPAEYQSDLFGARPRIQPAYGKAWPVTRTQLNAVRVRMEAGYESAEAIPGDIIGALRLYIGHRYANREEVITGTITAKLPNAYDVVADRYRVSWF